MNIIQQGTAVARVQNPANGSRGQAWRPFWALRIVVITALAMLLPATVSYPADGEGALTVHEITWLHTSPALVRSFVVFVSPEPAALAVARQINVGKPGESGSESAQIFSALIPVGTDDYVAVAAIGRNGLQSILSEWSQPQPSRPGQPLVVEP